MANIRYDDMKTFELDTSESVTENCFIYLTTDNKVKKITANALATTVNGYAPLAKTDVSSSTGYGTPIGIVSKGLVKVTGLVDAGSYTSDIAPGDYVSVYVNASGVQYVVNDPTHPIGRVFSGSVTGAGTGELILELDVEVDSIVSTEITYPLTVPTDKKIQFRDTGLYINSSANGQLDVIADTTAKVTAPTTELEASTSVVLDSPLISMPTGGQNTINMDSVSEYTAAVASGTLGNIIKMQYNTGTSAATSAGLVVKAYYEGGTIDSQTANGLTVFAKHKAAVTGGAKLSLADFHVHSSSTTSVDYGLRVFGDMTSSIDVTGGTVTSALDFNNATAVTNLLTTTTGKVATVGTFTNTVVAADPDGYVQIDIGGTPYYIPCYSTKPA